MHNWLLYSQQLRFFNFQLVCWHNLWYDNLFWGIKLFLEIGVALENKIVKKVSKQEWTLVEKWYQLALLALTAVWGPLGPNMGQIWPNLDPKWQERMSRVQFLIFSNKILTQCSKPCGKVALFDFLGILLVNLPFGPNLDL